MQKKSLLVALFCGALCLTGCLKNEESASVAQVRIAKANELNSIADLNKAKAQAEVIYANAEATIANAEAKLREANANLVNAQAETEKVRAELLKVQVQLAEVTVEEEKVKLQLLQADLEKHLAEVEAAVAKAEYEKQAWIKALEDLMAQAEVDAIKNAKALLEAEQELEEYLLTLAEDKAEAADEAAQKYFAALDAVQDLQKQQLQTKATKALVEAGAIQVRDAIHFMMDRIDDQIAENNTKLDYLKQYQTATPEEIEELLKEAWKELNEAYADYLAALKAEEAAEEAFDDAEDVESVYVDNWGANFGGVVKNVLADMPQTDYAQYGYSENVYVDEETGVLYNAAVKYDEDGNVTDIIPLWTASAPGKEQYFDEPLLPSVIDGIKQPTSALSFIYNRTYYPAKIEFDNIKEVFDAYTEWQEEELAEFDEAVEEYTEGRKETMEEQIEGWKADKKYFDDYVANATRKAMVEKAEKAIEDSIAVANKTHGSVRKAFEAYRDYMVKTYDVDRVYFENRYNAKNASVEADADSVKWQNALAEAKAYVATAEAALQEAVLLAHEKHGAWEKAKADYDAAEASAEADIATAKKSYNPDFNAEADTVWVNNNLYNGYREGTTPHYDESTKAGTAQVSTATAKKLMDEKAEALRNAKWLQAYWKGYGNAEKAAEYGTQVSTLEPQYTTAKNAYNGAVTAENNAKAGYVAAAGKVAKAQEAVDKALAALKKAVIDSEQLVDADSKPTTYGKYMAAIADTSYVDVVLPDDFDPEDEDNTTGELAKYYAQRATALAGELEDAEAALLAQLAFHMNVEEDDIESTADDKADELYKAWQDAEDEGDVIMEAAMDELRKVYWQCANQDHNGRFSNQFYWVNASYQVDPEYQFISGYEWDSENETYVLIKKYFRSRTDDEGEVVPIRRRSLAGRIQIAEEILADEEAFAELCKEEYLDGEEDPHVAFEEASEVIAEVLENLAEYEAIESAYVASVDNRNATHAAWVEAQIDAVVAEAEYEITKAMFEALKDIQNEGMYVYDPENDDANEDGFVWITLAEEIESLEGGADVLSDAVNVLSDVASQTVIAATDLRIDDADVMNIISAIDNLDYITDNGISNAELKAAKKVLQEVLKQGKVGLQIVLEAFDEEIAELDEKIEVYTKIAGIYKAVMNAYLGIEDEDVAGETGPLDGEGEGDDEE